MKKGTKVYGYDVNALYPYVMSEYPMPVGHPKHFIGDIFKHDPNAFGFFYCDVETPNNLEHPIIQLHHKTNDGIRTISPLGKFENMLFSEEIKNAQKYGYKFNIKYGYLFDKALIFKDYIQNLYNIRLSYPKTDPLNYTAKIIMNSLYGRFGMKEFFDTIAILDKDKFKKFKFNQKKKLSYFNIIKRQI